MRYWIIIILNFLSYLAEGQRADLHLGKQLLEKELQFFAAVSDSAKVTLLMEKAELYKSKAQYEMVLFELARAEKIDPRSGKLKYERMLGNFLLGHFNQSSSILISDEELLKIGRQKEYAVMRLSSLNENEQWTLCRKELLNYCDKCDSAQLNAIQALPDFYPYISPQSCKRLSGLIPGLGMAKAGWPVKGATSFLLQSGLVLGTAYCFYSGYYVAGIVSGVLPLIKFHNGGNRLSARLAVQTNEKEKMKLQAVYQAQIKKVVYR